MKKVDFSVAWAAFAVVGMLLAFGEPTLSQSEGTMQWLAGDHHVHSRYSVTWNRDVDPPEPIIGGAGMYPIAMNALMAKRFGLSWMVATDHGGRDHSVVTRDLAYPNLLVSREMIPEVVQFLGLEFNPPGGDHASLIMPITNDEAERLFELESRFDSSGGSPEENTEDRMLEALKFMNELPEQPLIIANHPSRSAMGAEIYGRVTPAELRGWNDAAPEVAIGMVGAPGHQARSIDPDGSVRPDGYRGGGYSDAASTRGGFDPMTAVLGGVWDSMLGDGRRWWITLGSDSHRHWTEPVRSEDFWPGEYAKTYVYADPDHESIVDGIREGRIFVTTGDLVSELFVTATNAAGDEASIGGSLNFEPGTDVTVTIRLLDPGSENRHGDTPTVHHVDLIGGEIADIQSDRDRDTHSSTRVIRRFDASGWTEDGEYLTMTERLSDVRNSFYVRVRGTSTSEAEPAVDPAGEDPWTDLWFYSNPIFLEVE